MLGVIGKIFPADKILVVMVFLVQFLGNDECICLRLDLLE